MCLAIPGQVKEIAGLQAIVQYPGETRKVLVGEDGIKVGDYVFVQMGIIVKKITQKEAKISLASWKKNPSSK